MNKTFSWQQPIWPPASCQWLLVVHLLVQVFLLFKLWRLHTTNGVKISIWSPILKFSTATARQSCEDNNPSMLVKQPAPYPQWTATASLNQPIMTEDYYLVEVSHGHHTEKGFGALSCRGNNVFSLKWSLRSGWTRHCSCLRTCAWLIRLPAAELVDFVCWPAVLFTLRQPGAMCCIS